MKGEFPFLDLMVQLSQDFHIIFYLAQYNRMLLQYHNKVPEKSPSKYLVRFNSMYFACFISICSYFDSTLAVHIQPCCFLPYFGHLNPPLPHPTQSSSRCPWPPKALHPLALLAVLFLCRHPMSFWSMLACQAPSGLNTVLGLHYAWMSCCVFPGWKRCSVPGLTRSWSPISRTARL